jgi:hypothetical protein
MTTNEIIALLFPLGTAAAVGLTGWLALRIWARPEPAVHTFTLDEAVDMDRARHVYEELGQADKLIQDARKRLLVPGKASS